MWQKPLLVFVSIRHHELRHLLSIAGILSSFLSQSSPTFTSVHRLFGYNHPSFDRGVITVSSTKSTENEELTNLYWRTNHINLLKMVGRRWIIASLTLFHFFLIFISFSSNYLGMTSDERVKTTIYSRFFFARISLASSTVLLSRNTFHQPTWGALNFFNLSLFFWQSLLASESTWPLVASPACLWAVYTHGCLGSGIGGLTVRVFKVSGSIMDGYLRSTPHSAMPS